MARDAVEVRPLRDDDLPAVVEIDERLGGHPRKEYWVTRFEVAALRPPWMSLVAELDNRVVGFLFGWTSESEFGIPGPVAGSISSAWTPPYRGRGVGRALVERFVATGRDLRAIEKVFTLIDLEQGAIREFFIRLGFRHGPLVHLEQAVGEEPLRPAGGPTSSAEGGGG